MLETTYIQNYFFCDKSIFYKSQKTSSEDNFIKTFHRMTKGGNPDINSRITLHDGSDAKVNKNVAEVA